MTTDFTSILRTVQEKQNSLLCVGLDTDPGKIPACLAEEEDPVFAFNRHVVEATQEFVCAYKLNLAFYESRGDAGWQSLRKTLAIMPPGIVTIGDGKRGDIGNTAVMYAKSLLDDFGACTVNPYMGTDAVAPFIAVADRGAFILALTSNPGAKDFQYLSSGRKPLYEHVILRVRKWNTLKNCGLVVGATRPRELQRVRTLVPGMPILIPGVGAQGGDLKASVRFGCTAQGDLAVINAGRSVLYASSGEDFADAARAAARNLCEEMNVYREKYFGG